MYHSQHKITRLSGTYYAHNAQQKLNSSPLKKHTDRKYEKVKLPEKSDDSTLIVSRADYYLHITPKITYDTTL